MRLPPRSPRPLAAVMAGLLLAGCGAAEDKAPTATPTTPHGYVEGAEETAEAQWRLVLAERASGAVHVLNPATEKVTEVDRGGRVTGMVGDGRFAYVDTGRGLRVIDGGAWTVDHRDHVHYYRTKTRSVGEVEGAATHVASDQLRTAVSSTEGVRILDRAALEDGKVSEIATVDGTSAVSVGDHVVVPAADGSVRTHGRDGKPAADLDVRCPDAQGQALTRRGAVVGCADGALLLDEGTSNPTAERIPYPPGTSAERPTEFRHRPGAPVLAARAGDRDVWVLDIAARKWTLLKTGPTIAVNAIGEDSAVLVLTDDGVLRSYDPATGKQVAETKLLKRPHDRGPAPTIQIDTARAYVNDPATRAVHEVDYNDDLRLARTFDLDFRPDHLLETGW